MSLNNFAMQTADRLPNVLSANGHVDGIRRASDSAQNLSRRVIYSARAGLMQTALELFINLCYERHEDSNIPANVERTGRIIIASPWSGRHHSAYGLRRTEADALRLEMHNRCLPENADPALFLYFEDERRWYLNISEFAALPAALGYAEQYPITWWAVHGYMCK